VQPEVFLKCIEIAIAVKQPEFALDAEGGNQTVDRASDRDAAFAQYTKILCCLYGKLPRSSVENRQG